MSLDSRDDNNEVLFQLPHVPVGDKMLFQHHRRFYKGGMDVVLSFPDACYILFGTPGVSLDLFLQTEEQRIQIQIPRTAF